MTFALVTLALGYVALGYVGVLTAEFVNSFENNPEKQAWPQPVPLWNVLNPLYAVVGGLCLIGIVYNITIVVTSTLWRWC